MSADREAGTFAEALATLKREGSGLLLVGPACDGTHLTLSRRLLGEDGGGRPRRRVLVLTDGVDAPERRLPASAATDRYRIIDRRPMTRGVAAQAGPDVDLDGLAREFHEAVDDLAPDDSFAPAELRVCVDSLRPFVDDPALTVEPWLDDVLDRVRTARGMAHAHLPVARDDPAVEALAPRFDAVVELRPDVGHDRLEHRGGVDQPRQPARLGRTVGPRGTGFRPGPPDRPGQ